MNILAIESSCDETATAVVKDGQKVLSNVVASQIDLHAKYGGVVPEVAARVHVQAIIPTIEEALKEAKLDWPEIDTIAVTQGPGLIGSLIVGTETARTLAILKEKPLIAVNHLEGHVYANWIREGSNDQFPIPSQFSNSNSQMKDRRSKELSALSLSNGKNFKKNTKYKIQNTEPTFPAICLLVSGGHTMLIKIDKHYSFEVVGSTLDDAAGEAFDKVAQLLALPYPGGPNISKLAEKGNEHKYKFPIIDLTPEPKRNSQGFLEYPSPSLDFSFSGLKTAVLNVVKQAQKSHTRCGIENKSDIAASFQKTLVDTLVQNSQRAIEQYKPKSFILSGGVAVNLLLRSELQNLCKKLKVNFSMPDLKYCTDNAAMISVAAFYKQKEYAHLPNGQGFIEPRSLTPNPNLKLA